MRTMPRSLPHGTIARLSDAGVRVVTAVLSLAETGVGAERRIGDTTRAADLLGYELCWPRKDLPLQVADYGEVALVATIDRLMADIAPHTVLTHWRGDGHVDHALTGRAVAAALRNYRADLFSIRPAEPRTIATSQFTPTVFVDISDYVKRKAEALEPFTHAAPGLPARGRYRRPTHRSLSRPTQWHRARRSLPPGTPARIGSSPARRLSRQWTNSTARNGRGEI